MFKRVFRLFLIARKLSISGAIDTINEIHEIPTSINLFFNCISIGSEVNRINNRNKPGEKLCSALQEMGTTFIKLGQFLATRPDIIGEEMAKDLEKLQDKVPAFDLYSAKKIIKKEIGEKQFNNIIEISEPIAAASIAQVHIAKIKNENHEKHVAIKILRPDIEKLFNEELDALMLFAYIIENTISKTKRLKLVEVVHLLREITNIEMDLRFEAAAANELYENTKQDQGFNVPQIYWNYTTKKILTLDKVDGISIREHNKLREQGVDLKKLAENLIQHFLKQAVRDGFFHGDMHQGNLFVDNEGNIIPVDFGIMGRLDNDNRRYLAEILYGFIKRDYEKVADVHFIAGLVPQDQSRESFSQALRSIGEPIFGQSIKNISAGRLLAQLFEITEQFNMATQPQLLLLQKTMVVVEGVARTLDEDANIWEISKPILEGWLKKEVGPEAKFNQVVQTTTKVIDRLPELPIMMDRASKALELLAAGTVASNNEIAKKFENEKLKIKNQQNQIIIFILLIVISLLIIFN